MAERKGEPERRLQRGPPPETGKRKPPSTAVHGLQPKEGAEEPLHGEASANLLAALKDVEFPASRDELIDRVGDRVVAMGDGRTVEVRTVLHRTAPAEFGSARDVVAEANALWDDVDRAAHGG